ncbi:hypothetical protein HGA34_05495 [Candidatus Falkowbacteria bacterium]|nr:hypothetical protein [Candidatus Falkowbacteria bacterium]
MTVDQQYAALKLFSEKMIVSALSAINCFLEPITLDFPESGPPLGYVDLPFVIEFKKEGVMANCNVFFDPKGLAAGTIVITDHFEGRFWFFSYVHGKLCSTAELRQAGNC